MKKGVLRNFTKFTGKHLRQSLFFNKATGLRPVRAPLDSAFNYVVIEHWLCKNATNFRVIFQY